MSDEAVARRRFGKLDLRSKSGGRYLDLCPVCGRDLGEHTIRQKRRCAS